MADCSRGDFQPPEMHDRQQWTAVYVKSLAVRKATTGDSGGWNRRCIVCNCKGTVAPDCAGIDKPITGCVKNAVLTSLVAIVNYLSVVAVCILS